MSLCLSTLEWIPDLMTYWTLHLWHCCFLLLFRFLIYLVYPFSSNITAPVTIPNPRRINPKIRLIMFQYRSLGDHFFLHLISICSFSLLSINPIILFVLFIRPRVQLVKPALDQVQLLLPLSLSLEAPVMV